jgi:DNA processing protein
MRNAGLQAKIGELGTLVSEYPYEALPLAWNFPQRNRVISGLAEGVLVIQAGLRSGAAITARFAAEQGRDVFAVPGSVLDPMSAGCHRLIQQGAKCVTAVSDILEDLGIEAGPPGLPLNNDPDFDTLSALEKHILHLLTEKTLSADELSQQTSRGFDQVASSLLALELKGKIRALPGQRYAKS